MVISRVAEALTPRFPAKRGQEGAVLFPPTWRSNKSLLRVTTMCSASTMAHPEWPDNTDVWAVQDVTCASSPEHRRCASSCTSAAAPATRTACPARMHSSLSPARSAAASAAVSASSARRLALACASSEACLCAALLYRSCGKHRVVWRVQCLVAALAHARGRC